ncbi:arginase family protein [Marinactinospora thermotolerans]|uniref:arginase family protein n=1 Tax=Marinactinospora thermotolerans TaxID=531310 RepID=UPI003D8CA90C
MKPIVLLDAPSNLGLRPPEEGSVPGCHKAPGALRDQGLLPRLGARDAGVVTPPRYRAAWTPGVVRNEEAVAGYTRSLADRISAILGEGGFPVVLGGDCSILLGAALALSGKGGHGLVYLDGHLDYRHPGNSDEVGACAGEGLALVTGHGGVLAELGGSRPYFAPSRVAALGFRPGDEDEAEVAGAGVTLLPAPAVGEDPAAAAATALTAAAGPDGTGAFWIHLDVDIIDAALLPAVDSPEPDGLDWDQLADLLAALVAAPGATGLDLTIYDPDLDPSAQGAHALVDVLARALSRG